MGAQNLLKINYNYSHFPCILHFCCCYFSIVPSYIRIRFQNADPDQERNVYRCGSTALLLTFEVWLYTPLTLAWCMRLFISSLFIFHQPTFFKIKIPFVLAQRIF